MREKNNKRKRDANGEIIARKESSARRNQRRRGIKVSKEDYHVIWEERNAAS